MRLTFAKRIPFESQKLGYLLLFEKPTLELGLKPTLYLLIFTKRNTLNVYSNLITNISFFQWTYQSMIHELIGIKNNTVDLTDRPEISEDLRQLTMSSTSDAFFRQNMYANFGEIGQTVKTLVNQFQEKSKSHQVLSKLISYFHLHSVFLT